MYLTANSLHIIELKPVIDALIITELALVYFLVLMWRSLTAASARKRSNSWLVAWLTDSRSPRATEMFQNLSTQPHLSAFDAFQACMPALADTFTASLPPIAAVATEKELEDFVTGALDVLKAGRKNFKKSQVYFNLQTATEKCTRTKNIEFVYFWLNMVAFYGYLLGILTFYVPYPEGYLANTLTVGGFCTDWFYIAKLGLTDRDADLWGNFAGDLAWTIEPAIALFIEPGYLHGDKDKSRDRVDRGRVRVRRTGGPYPTHSARAHTRSKSASKSAKSKFKSD